MGKIRLSSMEEGRGGNQDSIWTRMITWFPPVIWSAVIFYTSTLPGSSLNLPPFKFVDKLIHLFVYGMLSLLVLRIAGGAKNKTKAFFFGILYSILYGLSDEIHQYFVPGRFADPYDFLANVLGILLGYLIFIRFISERKGETERAEV